MIQCPKCLQALPDWATKCQFCQADVSKVSRPVAARENQSSLSLAPKWVWSAYYAACAYYVIDGLATIGVAIQQTNMKFMGETIGWSFMTYISIAFGAIYVLLGIGLAARVEVIRGVVNFFAGLGVIFGLFGLAGSLLGSFFSGPFGIILILQNVLKILINGLMIYLIGETDKQAPNY